MNNHQPIKKRASAPHEKSLGREILENVLLVIGFMAIYYLLFTLFLSNETVSGPSMQPTFENGDRLIAVRHSNLSRGDIVILKAPDEPGALYIKRIIGMPGDTVESKNDQIYINGKLYKQPYLNNSLKKAQNKLGYLYTENFTLKSKLGKTKVPANSYFVMGDHRPVSKDSRMIGFIKRSSIVGEVKLRYWPISAWSTNFSGK